jgi:hypothetical protein
MPEQNRLVSDPARDLIRAIRAIQSPSASKVMWQAFAETWGVDAWSDPYLLGLRALSANIQEVQDHLNHEISDEADASFNSNRIGVLRQWLSLQGLGNHWNQLGQHGGSLGPETLTFLQGASQMFRGRADYYHPTDADKDSMLGSLSEIIAAFEGVTLEESDFLREALVRGCKELQFILQNIEFFGYSRLIGPSAEMLAFVYTLQRAGEHKHQAVDWKKVGQSAKRFYEVLAELEKASKVFKFVKITGGTGLKLLGLSAVS